MLEKNLVCVLPIFIVLLSQDVASFLLVPAQNLTPIVREEVANHIDESHEKFQELTPPPKKVKWDGEKTIRGVQELRKLCKVSIKHHGMYGTISSPFYPHNYGNNISCIWGIRAPPKHLVEINIREFILEGGAQINKDENMQSEKKVKCTFDYLYIFEQLPGEPSLERFSSTPRIRKSLARFCGYKTPVDLKSTIPGSRIYFYFHTDSTKTEKGFYLMYRILPADASMPPARYTALDEEFHDITSKKEEEFLKVFSCIVFIFIFSTVLIGTLYKCWKSTAEQIANDGHVQHSCCCGAIQLDVIAGERHRASRMHRTRNPTPRLPTPPPEYGDIVKTEEDWNRVMERLGEASVTAIRQRLATEEVQVTYDLNNDEASRPATPAMSRVERTLNSTEAEQENNRNTASPTCLIPPTRPSRQVSPLP